MSLSDRRTGQTERPFFYLRIAGIPATFMTHTVQWDRIDPDAPNRYGWLDIESIRLPGESVKPSDPIASISGMDFRLNDLSTSGADSLATLFAFFHNNANKTYLKKPVFKKIVDLNAGVQRVSVQSTDGFPAQGVVHIGNEAILYDAIEQDNDGNPSFRVIERGAYFSQLAYHRYDDTQEEEPQLPHGAPVWNSPYSWRGRKVKLYRNWIRQDGDPFDSAFGGDHEELIYSGRVVELKQSSFKERSFTVMTNPLIADLNRPVGANDGPSTYVSHVFRGEAENEASMIWIGGTNKLYIRWHHGQKLEHPTRTFEIFPGDNDGQENNSRYSFGDISGEIERKFSEVFDFFLENEMPNPPAGQNGNLGPKVHRLWISDSGVDQGGDASGFASISIQWFRFGIAPAGGGPGAFWGGLGDTYIEIDNRPMDSILRLFGFEPGLIRLQAGITASIDDNGIDNSNVSQLHAGYLVSPYQERLYVKSTYDFNGDWRELENSLQGSPANATGTILLSSSYEPEQGSLYYEDSASPRKVLYHFSGIGIDAAGEKYLKLTNPAGSGAEDPFWSKGNKEVDGFIAGGRPPSPGNNVHAIEVRQVLNLQKMLLGDLIRVVLYGSGASLIGFNDADFDLIPSNLRLGMDLQEEDVAKGSFDDIGPAGGGLLPVSAVFIEARPFSSWLKPHLSAIGVFLTMVGGKISLKSWNTSAALVPVDRVVLDHSVHSGKISQSAGLIEGINSISWKTGMNPLTGDWQIDHYNVHGRYNLDSAGARTIEMNVEGFFVTSGLPVEFYLMSLWLLGTLGRPLPRLKVECTRQASHLHLGDNVKVTAKGIWNPKTGEYGLSDIVFQIVGKSFNPFTGRVNFELVTMDGRDEKIGPYAPSCRVEKFDPASLQLTSVANAYSMDRDASGNVVTDAFYMKRIADADGYPLKAIIHKAQDESNWVQVLIKSIDATNNTIEIQDLPVFQGFARPLGVQPGDKLRLRDWDQMGAKAQEHSYQADENKLLGEDGDPSFFWSQMGGRL